jgi:hypothetical protein
MKNIPNSPDYGKHLLVRAIYTTRKNCGKVARADIPKFLAMLHGAQLDYLDEAVLKSDMAEAKAVIQHIMEKK